MVKRALYGMGGVCSCVFTFVYYKGFSPVWNYYCQPPLLRNGSTVYLNWYIPYRCYHLLPYPDLEYWTPNSYHIGISIACSTNSPYINDS